MSNLVVMTLSNSHTPLRVQRTRRLLYKFHVEKGLPYRPSGLVFFVLLCHGNATKYNTLNGRCQFDFELKENSSKNSSDCQKTEIKADQKYVKSL